MNSSLFERYIKRDTPKKELTVPRFGDLISERVTARGSLNILVLSVKSNKEVEEEVSSKWTVNRIKGYCTEKNIPCYIAFMGDSYISNDGVLKIHNNDDKDGFVIDPSKTIAMVRDGLKILKSNAMGDLISQLERHNIFCLNSREAIEVCGDKYRTYLNLTDVGLPCPRSVTVHNEEMISSAHEKIGNKFPVVVKLLSGSKGVFILDSEISLKSTLHVIWEINPSIELLLQEFIKSDYDICVHVLGDNIIASMKREVEENDFRSRYSLGGKVEQVELSDDVRSMCKKAVKSVNAIWAGVDVIIDKESGTPFIIEVDSSPNTFFMEKATKKDIVSEVMTYVADRKTWQKTPRVCGYQEMIEIDKVGSLVAKFDTGNGAISSIHAESIVVDDKAKQVTWSFNSNKFEHIPYKRKISYPNGSVKVTVGFDVRFDGELYKGVEFVLDDRGGKTTPVLLNRDFMKDINIIVNPSKAFLITDEPKEKTDTDDTEGEEQNG